MKERKAAALIMTTTLVGDCSGQNAFACSLEDLFLRNHQVLFLMIVKAVKNVVWKHPLGLQACLSDRDN